MSRPRNPNSFIGAGFALLLVMQVEELDPPMAISWSAGYGQLPRLHVQVDAKHFRAWLDQLTEPEMNQDLVEGEYHIHAEGLLKLAPATRVHLVTVSDPWEAAS